MIYVLLRKDETWNLSTNKHDLVFKLRDNFSNFDNSNLKNFLNFNSCPDLKKLQCLAEKHNWQFTFAPRDSFDWVGLASQIEEVKERLSI